jgi:NADH:ubiquinone oxidoreductase subunit 2 (subunit N)
MLSILNNYLFFLFLTTLAISNNLILFFISWIGMNVTLYGILLKSYNTYNKEITVKYFVSGSIITIFILFAILLYFMDYFTFNIDSSSYLFLNSDSLNLTLESVNISKLQKTYYSILISAFLFKLGSFPFHFYIADMYTSIKYIHTMLLYTIVLKIVMFFKLIKYLSCFWYLNTTVTDLLICSGFGSIFISSFTIIRQFKIMNFWAYSYINTVGYTILSLSSGISAEFGELTFYSAKIYFLIYLIVWYGIMDLMASFSLIRPSTPLGNIKSSIYYINDFIFFSEI